MPSCKIKWIDTAGNETADDNEAVGYAICFAAAELKPSPICQCHLERMPLTGWMFIRASDTTPEKLAATVAEVKIVTDAIQNAFKDAYKILPTLRYHPGDGFYSFIRWGMFVGVEKDGYIHT